MAMPLLTGGRWPSLCPNQPCSTRLPDLPAKGTRFPIRSTSPLDSVQLLFLALIRANQHFLALFT